MIETSVSIVSWRPELRVHFERMNMVWLEEFGLFEDADRLYLQNPERMILEPGGQIFFALDGDEVLGTCAAIPISGDAFELAKLTVSPSAQKRGVGRRLCERVLEFARASGASTVVLTSNSQLTPALRLYKSLGFRDAPLPAHSPYVTADVYMTKTL